MNVSIPSLPVKKDIAAVDLVLIQIHVPALAEIVHCDENATVPGSTRRGGEKVPHKPRFPPVSGLCKLNLGKYLVTACRLRLGEIRVETKAEVGAIKGSVLKLERIDREILPGLRGRDVLITKRIKAVIGAYKEILARDVRRIVKGRPVAYNGLCKVIPGQLNRMLQRPPGSQRPTMNIELAVLRVSPGEFTPAFLLVVAAAVDMIEGEVSEGTPAIRYEYGRREARHSSRYRSIRYANLRKNSENRSHFHSHFFANRTDLFSLLGRFQAKSKICSHF